MSHRSSCTPFLSPATETGWQGNPAVTISTFGGFVILVRSPRLGFLNLFSRILFGASLRILSVSMSLTQTSSVFRTSGIPSSIPPYPAQRAPTLYFFKGISSYYAGIPFTLRNSNDTNTPMTKYSDLNLQFLLQSLVNNFFYLFSRYIRVLVFPNMN